MTKSKPINRRRFIQALTAITGYSILPLTAQEQARVFTVAGTGIAGYEAEPRGGSVATRSPMNNPYGVVPLRNGVLSS